MSRINSANTFTTKNLELYQTKKRWVIPISDDKSAITTLVLAQSLKRVGTTGLITGLLYSTCKISEKLLDLLSRTLSELIISVPGLECETVNSCSREITSEIPRKNSSSHPQWAILDPYYLVLRNCDELLLHKSVELSETAVEKNSRCPYPVIGNNSDLFSQNSSQVKIVRVDGIQISSYLAIYRNEKILNELEKTIWNYWWNIYLLQVKPHITGSGSLSPLSHLICDKIDSIYSPKLLKNIILVSAHTELLLSYKLNMLLERHDIGENCDFHPSEVHSPMIGSIVTEENKPHSLHRIAITGNNIHEILQNIQQNVLITSLPNLNPEKKVCFLFTGQGCQYENMGQGLYESCPEYKVHVDYCHSIVMKKFGINLANMPKDFSKMSSYLQNVYSNVPTFIVQYSLFKTWEAWGVRPDYILSHSLGEYAGSVASGFMSCEDGISLIIMQGKHFKFVEQSRSMVLIKANETTATNLIDKFESNESECRRNVEFVAINSSTQVVLAGPTEVIKRFTAFCSKKGIQSRMFPSLFAFHTSIFKTVHHHQLKITRAIQYLKPQPSKYISGMTGDVLEQMDESFWPYHAEKPVQFIKGCETAFKKNCNVFLEIGPRPILTSLVKANKDHVGLKEELLYLPSLKQNEDDLLIMIQSLGHLYVNGIDVDLGRFRFV